MIMIMNPDVAPTCEIYPKKVIKFCWWPFSFSRIAPLSGLGCHQLENLCHTAKPEEAAECQTKVGNV